MQKQILAFKDIIHDNYSVMVVWSSGNELKDIERVEEHYKFDSLDDVIKIREALDGILAKWGDSECMKQRNH